MNPQQIIEMIKAGIPDAEVVVEGDDGVHFGAQVISDAFAGLSKVKQHQLVYAALGDSFKSALHALALQTYTREQWAQVVGNRLG
ncbi:MAG: BolA/IbaG family iron-sulfur metabolism protein [Gammaproteobacteria bacterium]|nr:BolA/IbaG family iron-sulfur metabolism protein [Gammaproteobacteria bacterium]